MNIIIYCYYRCDYHIIRTHTSPYAQYDTRHSNNKIIINIIVDSPVRIPWRGEPGDRQRIGVILLYGSFAPGDTKSRRFSDDGASSGRLFFHAVVGGKAVDESRVVTRRDPIGERA